MRNLGMLLLMLIAVLAACGSRELTQAECEHLAVKYYTIYVADAKIKGIPYTMRYEDVLVVSTEVVGNHCKSLLMFNDGEMGYQTFDRTSKELTYDRMGGDG